MTISNLYKQATKSLQETFSILQQVDSLFTEEVEVLYKVLEKSPKKVIKGMLQGPLPSLHREEIIILVGDFLDYVNREYATKFYNDLYDNKIVFGKFKEGSFYGTTNGSTEKKVYVDETHTIDDAISLLHEFFHSLNENEYVYRQSFTDSVSITAELLFLEYLKEKGYSEYDIALSSNRRNNIFLSNTDYLRKLLPLYIEISKGNPINANTYKKYSHNYNGKKEFNEILKNEIEEADLRLERALMYRHSIGYIAASTFHQLEQDKIDLIVANETLKSGVIGTFNIILGNGIFESNAPYYTSKELTHFNPKVYQKKQD